MKPRAAFSVLVVLLVLVLAVACEPLSTPTPTSIVTPTLAPSSTPTRTNTPTPTATTVPCPVCPQCTTGDIILHCVDGLLSTHIQCQVQLDYWSDLPASVASHHGFTATSGIIAQAVLPGPWALTVYDMYNAPLNVDTSSPEWRVFTDNQWVDNPPVLIWVTAGRQEIRTLSFYKNPTPVATGTPTVTPTPAPHACKSYETMCQAACNGSFIVDPYGQCGAGFVCCVVAPTRTAVP
jgi:hypothetical protein